MMKRLVILLVSCAGFAPFALAHTAAVPPVHGRAVSTHHSVVVAGHRYRYKATAGTLILHNAKGQPTARMFYIAYTLDGVHDESRRPITFAYNGGP
jgi:carboxypeptidase C (cathepsin A)